MKLYVLWKSYFIQINYWYVKYNSAISFNTVKINPSYHFEYLKFIWFNYFWLLLSTLKKLQQTEKESENLFQILHKAYEESKLKTCLSSTMKWKFKYFPFFFNEKVITVYTQLIQNSIEFNKPMLTDVSCKIKSVTFFNKSWNFKCKFICSPLRRLLQAYLRYVWRFQFQVYTPKLTFFSKLQIVREIILNIKYPNNLRSSFKSSGPKCDTRRRAYISNFYTTCTYILSRSLGTRTKAATIKFAKYFSNLFSRTKCYGNKTDENFWNRVYNQKHKLLNI